MIFHLAVKAKYEVIALNFSKDVTKESILKELNTKSFVYILVSDKGNISLNYEIPGERSVERLGLYAKDKMIDLRNEILTSSKQKLLKFLLATGIIDRTWKLKKDSQDVTEDFDFFLDPRNALTRSFNGKLSLYHGTSSQDWDSIKKKGLVPLLYGSNMQPGFESRFKHEGNLKVLYLTGDFYKAKQYARTRCTSIQIKAKREGKETHEDRFGIWIDKKQITPVVLRVAIPNINNLVADDDYINSFARDVAYKLWENKSETEKKDLIPKLKKARPDLSHNWAGWDDPTNQVMIWRETDEGFKEVMSHIPKAKYKEWFNSLIEGDNQVGYRGIIPPKFIKREI